MIERIKTRLQAMLVKIRFWLISNNTWLAPLAAIVAIFLAIQGFWGNDPPTYSNAVNNSINTNGGDINILNGISLREHEEALLRREAEIRSQLQEEYNKELANVNLRTSEEIEKRVLLEEELKVVQKELSQIELSHKRVIDELKAAKIRFATLDIRQGVRNAILVAVIEAMEQNFTVAFEHLRVDNDISSEQLAVVYYEAGRLAERSGRLPEALAYFQQAVFLDQSNSDFLLAESNLLARIGALSASYLAIATKDELLLGDTNDDSSENDRAIDAQGFEFLPRGQEPSVVDDSLRTRVVEVKQHITLRQDLLDSNGLNLVPDKDSFKEQYGSSIAISGDLLAGFMSSGTHNLFDDGRLYVIFAQRAGNPGEKICVRLSSADGLYSAHWIVTLDKVVTGTVRLAFASRYEEQLKITGFDAVTAVVSLGRDCAISNGVILPGSWQLDFDRGSHLTLYLQTMGRANVAYVEEHFTDNREPIISLCSDPSSESDRLRYDKVCSTRSSILGVLAPMDGPSELVVTLRGRLGIERIRYRLRD